MSLIRWQPLKELDAMRHQMNRLFDEMTHSDREFDLFPKLENVLWAPAIELKETDNNLILKAVVPGIEAKDLDVQVSENAVSITGEHREEKRTEEKGYFRSELQYGQFQRTVPLPVSIKHDQVQSEFKDGVLTLTLPKAESNRQNVTKINLTTQEKARESVAQQRQHEEHLQETMRTRAAAEMKTSNSTSTQEEARESMVEQRQHEEHLQETMQQRTTNNIGSSVAH
jgi:HSP20 family protein